MRLHNPTNGTQRPPGGAAAAARAKLALRPCCGPSARQRALASGRRQQLAQSSWRPARRAGGVAVRAAGGSGGDGDGDDGPSTSGGVGIPAALLLFVGSAAYTLANMRDELADLVYSDEDALGDLALAGFGLGDVAGALLWAAALWFVSPLQLLLVFLGRVDTERPSDWLMGKLGRASGQPVDAVDYEVPLWIRAAAVLGCLAGGAAVSALLESGLGDPTWAVSSGIGALFAAAIFEAGRPARLSVAEAQELEAKWQEFAAFAERRLQRSGRCHETEVFTAFRQQARGSSRSLSDSTLRDMLRNWHSGLDRTRTGFLRNASFKPAAAVAAAAAAAQQQRQQRLLQEQQQQPSQPQEERSLLDNIAEQAGKEQQQQQEVGAGTASTPQAGEH